MSAGGVKLFVGGLAWATDDRSLRSKFEEFGEVLDAVVVTDRETSRSRGFGFVTFANDEAAGKAIEAMNDADLDGRRIRVDRAAERGSGGGNGGRSGYGGSSYGGSGRSGYGGERSGGYGGERSSGGYGGRSSGGYGGERSGGYSGERNSSYSGDRY